MLLLIPSGTEAEAKLDSIPIPDCVLIADNFFDNKVTKEPAIEAEEESVDNIEYEVSEYASAFKSYMDYRSLTDTSSKQYEMQQEAYTDANGLRKIDEHFCVAMGTYYGEVGDILYIETDEGASWTVILSDIKSDVHTDSTHRYTVSNNCMMEFIVDTYNLASDVELLGTVNSLGFQGKICKVTKIN